MPINVLRLRVSGHGALDLCSGLGVKISIFLAFSDQLQPEASRLSYRSVRRTALHYLAKPGALNPKSGGGGGGRHSADRRVQELPPLRNLLNPQIPRTLEALPRGSIVVPFWDYLIGFYI